MTDVILIGLSVLIWHDKLGLSQIAGCALALAGIVHHLHGNLKSIGYSVLAGTDGD